MQADPLYLFLNKRLHDYSNMNESTDEFIFNVVCDYIVHLHHIGHIPARHELHVEELLREDVQDMLQKKIYGFFDIREYRRCKKVPPA